MNRIVILLASLLVVGNVYALPPCPSSGVWHYCFGTETSTHGDKYVGDWKDGTLHGQGTYTWANGSKYVGEWEADNRHGQGTYALANGGKYVGEWKAGKKHGRGTETLTNGNRHVGEFIDNLVWNGIQYHSTGKVLGAFYLGSLCDGCKPTPAQQALAQEAESITRAIRLSRKLIGTGTGFIVSRGYIATAEHVLDKCNAVSVVFGHQETEAQTISKDKNNDLALLRFNAGVTSTAKLRKSALRMGESAINFGYPLRGVLSANPQITAGYISSLAGYENNSASFQYSAPTQFGNSGGPVLDASGNIIGVVSGGLSDSKTQLVNFATKSTILEGFLQANKVPFEKADLEEELKLPDIAEKAETFTVLVGCWE